MASSSNRPTRSTGRGAPSRTPVSQRTAGASGRTATAAAAAPKRKFFDYPRSGKGPVRRWVPSWRVVVGSGLTLVALVCGLVIAAYASIQIPDADDFALAQSSKVYYSDGVTEMATFADQNREIVTTEEIPEYVKQAVVAAEDRSFYENSGIDPQGMARAFVGNLKGGRTTGGSTITQQYVERYYTGQTTTDYVGKFKEALMAVKIDRAQDKDEILTNYLNTIYFGRGANGIQTAALAYFGVPASALTLEQAALIAGVIPSPTNWDPRNDPEKAEQRWNYVLDGMVTKEFITQAERDALVYPQAIPFEQKNKLAGPTGYLLDMVTRELDAKAGIPEEELLTGGLTIVTTIDKGIQDMAVAAVAEMPQDSAPNLVKTIVTMDPATGGYLALYGGADFTVTQFNAATQGAAQAGSTFKPFTLIAGLEAGKTLNDTFDGNSPKTFGDYKVANFGLDDFGTISLEKATANSVNTAFVELNEEIGPEKTVDAAVRAGVPPEGLEANLANVLGTATVRPVDITSAYATFAAQGVKHEAHILASVTRNNGEVAYTPPNVPEQVFQAADVAELTYALTQVVEKGSGKPAKELDVPIAGKTGTSQDNKSAWFVGYTPQFVTAVTLYQSGPNGEQESITPFGGKKEITGGSIPVEVWTSYMGKVLDGRDVVEFPERTKKSKPTPTATPTPTPTPTTEAPVEPTEEPVAKATVPGGLVGRSQGEAEGAVRAAGLNASVTQSFDPNVKNGVVISVVPGEGSPTDAGSTVTIVVSKGPDPSTQPQPQPQPSAPAPGTTTPPVQQQGNGAAAGTGG